MVFPSGSKKDTKNKQLCFPLDVLDGQFFLCIYYNLGNPRIKHWHSFEDFQMI